MITHVWSVICERSIQDKDTNLLSLINIFEEFTVQGKPEPDKQFRIPIEIVSLWVRSDIEKIGNGLAKYSFISPSGKELSVKEVPVDLTEYERVRNRIQFINLNLPDAGVYNFQVSFRVDEKEEWKTKASIPLKVIFKED